MKKYRPLSVILLTALLLLTACTGFEISEEEQPLIGNWVSRPYNETIMTVTFRDDKSAEISINKYTASGNIEEEILSVSGYWSLYDGKLSVNYGENLTAYTIPFSIAEDSLQCKWRGIYILYRET